MPTRPCPQVTARWTIRPMPLCTRDGAERLDQVYRRLLNDAPAAAGPHIPSDKLQTHSLSERRQHLAQERQALEQQQGLCSTRVGGSLAAQGLLDSLVGVHAAACGGADDGAYARKQVSAPLGAEAASEPCGKWQWAAALVQTRCCRRAVRDDRER